MASATHVVIEISGGLVSAVLANGTISVTVVDHDNIRDGGDAPPALPVGLTYDAAGDVVIGDEAWAEVAEAP